MKRGGSSSLSQAIRSGNLDDVKQSLKAGEAQNYHGVSDDPLFDAAYYGKLEIVKYLVKRGFDVNVKVKIWGSPLHGAIEREHFPVVKFLRLNGASLTTKDGDGKTPLQLAESMRSDENILHVLSDKSLKNVMASKAHVVKYNKEWEENIGTEPTLGPARHILEFSGDLPAKKGVGPSMPHYKADPDRKLGPGKWHIGKSRRNKRSKGSKKTHRRK